MQVLTYLAFQVPVFLLIHTRRDLYPGELGESPRPSSCMLKGAFGGALAPDVVQIIRPAVQKNRAGPSVGARPGSGAALTLALCRVWKGQSLGLSLGRKNRAGL